MPQEDFVSQLLALIRISMSAGMSSVVSTTSQSRPSRRRTSAKLRLDGLQSPTLLADQAIQLFGNDLCQIANDAFGEDARTNRT